MSPGPVSRRRLVRVLTGVIILVVAAVIAFASAAGALSPTPPPSCPTGADTWQGGATGAWETAANWSSGVPTASDYVCITTASAAVTMNSTDTVTGLLLGSGESLDIQTEGLELSGAETAKTPSALQGSLTVAEGATLTVGGAATLLNASGGSITSPGAVKIAGTFEQDAGTVAGASADNPVVLQSGSSMKFAGTGTGAFRVAAAGTVALSGDIAPGQSLEMQVDDSAETIVNATASFTNAGTITMDKAPSNPYGGAILHLPSGDTLTNTATIDVSGPGNGASDNENEDETINGSVDNQGTLNVGVSGQPVAYLILPAGANLTNTGKVNVGAGSTLSTAATVSNETGGAIANAGSILASGSFDQGAGTVSTDQVTLENGSSLTLSGGGAGAFEVANVSGTVSLSGNISADQSLEIPSTDSPTTTINAAGSFTNAGTITVENQSGPYGSVVLNLPSGDTLTNTGSIELSGPSCKCGSTDYEDVELNGSLENRHTLNVGVSGKPPAYLTVSAGHTLTNTGTINVTAGGTLEASGAITGANPVSAATVDNSTGSIANAGSIAVAGAFIQGTGAITTDPVTLLSGSSLTSSGSGAAAFDVANVSSTVALSGNIAADQSLEIPSTDSDTTTINAAGSFTNAGTITVENQSGPYGSAVLNLPSGSTLTNTGSIDLSGPPCDCSATDYEDIELNGSLDNQGALNVGVSGKPPAYLTVSAGHTLTNTGTINVLSSSTLQSAADFTAEKGTIAVNGTLRSSGRFVYQGGNVTGGPISAIGGQLVIQGSAPVKFLVPAGGDPSLTGNIAAGQNLTIDDTNGFGGGTLVNATAPFTNAGTITLLANEYANDPAQLAGGSSLLTNTGTISFQMTAAGGGEIDMPVLNEASGIVSVSNGGSANISGAFTNDGTVSVKWGTLDLSGGLSNIGASSTLSGGAYRVLGATDEPATLAIPQVTVDSLAGTLEVGQNASFIEPTSKDPNFALATIAKGGSLTLDRGATDAPTASSLSNEGSVVLEPKAQLNLGSYTQAPSGSLTDAVAGEPNSGELGTIAATGSVTLAGTLAIKGAPGFTPASGAVYTAITGAPVTGAFSHFSATAIAGGLVYAPAYTPTSVRLDVSPGVDLSAGSVSAPSIVKVGDALHVGWKVTALGKEVPGEWSDAVYLSQSGSVSAGAVLLGDVTHTGGLSAGQSYNGSLSTTVPGVLPGNWRVVVLADAEGQTADINRANNIAVSPSVSISQNVLGVGSSVSGTIPPGGNVYVEIDPAAASNLSLTATFAESATGAMYEAFGRVPGPEGYDQASTSSSSEVQQLTVADTQSGAYYVDLNNPTSSAQPYTLASSTISLAVSAVTPASSSFVYDVVFNCDGLCPIGVRYFGEPPKPVPAKTQPDLTVTITGVGFTPESHASLSCEGLTTPYPGGANGQFSASSVTFVSSTEIYADFGPLFSPTGNCSVSVTSAGHTGHLAGAITFKSTTVVSTSTSSAPDSPNVSVIAPSINRPKTDSEVAVNYTNPYPYEIPAPLLELTATGATLHFPDQPAGDGSTLPVLGTGPTGDPAVLAPHASGSVEVLFDPTVGAHEAVEFSLGVIEHPNGEVDLGSILASMLPEHTDPAIVEYIKAQGGMISAEQLQSRLDADATYLSSLGESVSDTERLFAYELNKLTDYGQIAARHINGPFGEGLPGLVDSATLEAAGNVTVTDPTGSSANFAALPGGGYAAPAGVRSSLAAGSSEGWVMTQPGGASDTFNSSGQLVTSTDGYANTTSYAYSEGELTSVTEPGGNVISYTYNEAKDITSSKESATGRETAFTYDGSDHLASISSGGSTQQMTWNSSSNIALDGTLASITEGSGAKLNFAYDSQGRPTAITTGNGATLDTFAYPTNTTMEISDAEGNKSTDYLNEGGAIARAFLPDGTETSVVSNSREEPVAETLGNATELLGYNSEGELTSAVNPQGQQTSLAYSAASGTLAGFTEPAGPQTAIETNAQGSPTTITSPDGDATDITYTATGQIASKTDRDGKTTNFTYDAAGDLTSEELPGGGIETFGYDSDHNLTSANDSAGTTSYTYDAENRPTSVTYPTGLGVSFTYNSAGQRASETTSDGYTLNYHYDSAGHLASLSDGAGATIVSYTYTTDGQPASITNGNGTSTHYTYDSRGEQTSVVNDAHGGAVSSKFEYTHNDLGETTSVTSAAGTTNYTYDPAGELVKATLPGGRTLTYSYDADGNRSATSDSASGATAYAVNGEDQYTSAGATSYTYDADGNLASSKDASGTTSYDWDAEGRLESVSGPSGTTNYTYDALGTLIAEDSNGTTTNMLSDPADRTLLGEYNVAGSPLTHYPVGLGVVGQADSSGATSYYGFDGSGNVVSLSDPAGATADSYQYLPFGQVSAHTGASTTPFGFAGQFGITTDSATGLTQNGSRDYDPETGRFISQDSTLLNAADPYEYAANDPIDNVDTSGHQTAEDKALNDEWNGFVGAFTGDWSNVNGAGLGNDPYGTIVAGGQASLTATSTVVSTVGVIEEGVLGTGLNSTAILGNGLTVANNVVNIVGADVNQAMNGKTNLDKGQGVANIALHSANTFLELRFAKTPFFGQLLEGSENVVNVGWRYIFDRYWEYPDDPNIWGDNAQNRSNTHTAHDPNDMVGPAGYGEAGFIQGDTPLPYQVDFSNLASATLPAAVVKVTEPLDHNVDLSTFSLGSFGFGSHVVTPPPGLRSYQATIDDETVSGLDVDVKAALDTTTRTVTWTFTSIDPATGLAPTDAAAGFLPPDETPPLGEGFVSYNVTPPSSLSTGTVISANATVKFDTNEPMSTSTVSNTIDAGTPTATVNPLPENETGPFTVSWSGSDEAGGSGIASYDVLVSNDGEPYVPLATDTTATSTTFTGQVGHIYAFIAVATGNVGNTQTPPTAPQAETAVVSPGGGESTGPTETKEGNTGTTGSTSGVPPTGTTNSTVPTPQASETTLGNQQIKLTTPSALACTPSTGKLAVSLASATLANAKAAKLKFSSAAFYLDKGVKHTRKKRTGKKTVTHVTYSANATSTHLPVALQLSLAALSPGGHTLTVKLTYTQTKTSHGHRKTSKLTKTLTAKLLVCPAAHTAAVTNSLEGDHPLLTEVPWP